MNHSIDSDNNEIISNDMTFENYNDMIENQEILDNYFDISKKIYDEIYQYISSCPNDLFKYLNEHSYIDFWKFILENCNGIKYINHINTIYAFKDKYNN